MSELSEYCMDMVSLVADVPPLSAITILNRIMDWSARVGPDISAARDSVAVGSAFALEYQCHSAVKGV